MLIKQFFSTNVPVVLIRLLVLIMSSSILVSCAIFKMQPAGIGKPVDWSNVDGWNQDNHVEVWPALLHNCTRLKNQEKWKPICTAGHRLNNPDNKQVQQFFETWFIPHQLHGGKGKKEGLITGYYEPLVFGSKTADERYRYPLYQQPDNLLIVDLAQLYPDLKGKRVRGRVEGNKVIPFYSREEIEQDRSLLSGNELIWLDDRDASFFLHIQGSGRVQLDSGEIVGVGYANQNGHPYVAIGRVLLNRGELKREEISLFTIRQWLRDNPEQAEALLNENPSYVFFVLREEIEAGPVGSLNVPLTAQRSIAIDPKLVDLGTPIWLSTNYPGKTDSEYNRLVIAQDTGGAIKGPLRADLFWGYGAQAEQAAGIMKERGSMIVLLPKGI